MKYKKPHRGRNGRQFSSKSEMLIAEAVEAVGLPDTYEAVLLAAPGHRLVSPDWVWMSALGDFAVLEHTGFPPGTNPGYDKRWQEKKAAYADMPKVLLFTTHEADGLDIPEVILPCLRFIKELLDDGGVRLSRILRAQDVERELAKLSAALVPAPSHEELLADMGLLLEEVAQ